MTVLEQKIDDIFTLPKKHFERLTSEYEFMPFKNEVFYSFEGFSTWLKDHHTRTGMFQPSSMDLLRPQGVDGVQLIRAKSEWDGNTYIIGFIKDSCVIRGKPVSKQ